MKANSAARSDGGQELTAEITAKRSRVSNESEEAMCLCLVFVFGVCCFVPNNGSMQWGVSLHVLYIYRLSYQLELVLVNEMHLTVIQ